MNSLDDFNRRRAAQLDESLHDITNRPSNAELWITVVVQSVICAAVGGGLLFVIGACAGVQDGYALMGLIGLGGVAGVWWCVRAMRRSGRKTRVEYIRHGGDPAGTSDMLFGAVIYKIMPDGRWKWPEPSTGGE